MQLTTCLVFDMFFAFTQVPVKTRKIFKLLQYKNQQLKCR